MIMSNKGISQCDYYNTVFASVEKVDDYTVKFVTKESFPRLALKFGVTIWGNLAAASFPSTSIPRLKT